jgi:hypothetical protein
MRDFSRMGLEVVGQMHLSTPLSTFSYIFSGFSWVYCWCYLRFSLQYIKKKGWLKISAQFMHSKVMSHDKTIFSVESAIELK